MTYSDKSTERLFAAIASMQSPDEVKALFADLCTIKEIQDMAQRLDTAVLLHDKCSYQKIAAAVGVSTATISRVNRCLTYGEGGYRIAIERMKETEKTK